MSTSAAPLTPRRQQLVEAAVQVVAVSGLRGLTHRAVDAQAGLPEGSCSAYLRTRLALLTALVEYVAAQLRRDVEEAATQLIGVDDPAEVAAGIADLLAGWMQRPELMIVRAELMLEAIRTPDLRATYRPWRDDLVQLVATSIDRHGRDRPVERAEAVVASLEGVLTAALLRAEADRAAYVRQTVGTIMGALVAHEPPS